MTIINVNAIFSMEIGTLVTAKSLKLHKQTNSTSNDKSNNRNIAFFNILLPYVFNPKKGHYKGQGQIVCTIVKEKRTV